MLTNVKSIKEYRNSGGKCYSITGLDKLEKTTTQARIQSLVEVRKNGIDAFPVIHLYIHEYSNVEEVMELLEKNQFKEVNWKGFRYNKNNMKSLEKYIPEDILNKYIGEGKEDVIENCIKRRSLNIR